ncbi:MAG: hypothetical protein ACR5LF_05800 [Symbiopectobacterium sp.]
MSMTYQDSSPLANEAVVYRAQFISSGMVVESESDDRRRMTVADWLMAQILTDEEKIKANLKLSDDAWHHLGHWGKCQHQGKMPTPGNYLTNNKNNK